MVGEPAAHARRALDLCTQARRPAAPRLERVTRTTAMTSWPALSSDARLIAYVSDAGQDGTTPQIWIQQLGGAALRLTNGERQYSHLSFSPDNTRIIFTANRRFGSECVRGSDAWRRTAAPAARRRAAARFPQMVSWLASVSRTTPPVIQIAARGGSGFRTVASATGRCGVPDVACRTAGR